MPVLRGGPVQRDRGFVLHRPARSPGNPRCAVSDALQVTTSRDMLAAMARARSRSTASSRSATPAGKRGQLEEELLQNAWLTVPGDDR